MDCIDDCDISGFFISGLLVDEIKSFFMGDINADVGSDNEGGNVKSEDANDTGTEGDFDTDGGVNEKAEIEEETDGIVRGVFVGDPTIRYNFSISSCEQLPLLEISSNIAS